MGDVESGEAQDFFGGRFVRLFVIRFGLRLIDGGSNQSECLFLVGVRQEAVEAYFHEAGRQDVQQEAADELGGFENDAIGFVFFAVARGESDLAIGDVFDPVVIDGDAVGIAPEIVQNLGRAAEGALGVDVPALVFFGGVEQAFEGGWFDQWLELSVELQFSFHEGTQEVGAIFCGKDIAECADGKKKARARRTDEFGAAQDTGGKDDVQVEMIAQFLVPGVQDGDEPGLPFEFPFGVPGEARERFVDGAEEQSEQNGFVL